MFQLTKEQKVSNLEELINQKNQKIRNLQKEVENLQKKRNKLISSTTNNDPKERKESSILTKEELLKFERNKKNFSSVILSMPQQDQELWFKSNQNLFNN